MAKGAEPDHGEEGLADDVKAYAAKLGLASSGGGDFGYDDFAPQLANKPLKPSADKKKQKVADKQQQQQKSKPATAQPAHRDDGKSDKQHHKQSSMQQGSNRRQQGGATAKPPAAAAAAPPAGEDPIRDRKWVPSVGPRPGESRGKSLLARDEPSIWFEAAASLDPLPDPQTSSAQPLDDSAAQAVRARAEQLLEHEAQVFERDLAKRNASDAKWLQQVKRAGTTADKVAAMALLVQVRRPLLVWTKILCTAIIFTSRRYAMQH